MKRETAQDKRLLLPRRNNFSIQTVSLRCYLYTFIFFITATNFSQTIISLSIYYSLRYIIYFNNRLNPNKEITIEIQDLASLKIIIFV